MIESLPRRLTEIEEQKCIDLLYKKGDQKAREVLINHNLRLVAYIIHKHFDNVGIDKDDLFSIGSIGLVKGVDSYRPEKNSKISTYLSVCITNEILLAMRYNKRQKRTMQDSLDAPIMFNNEKEKITLGDFVKAEKDYIEEVNSRMDNEKYLSKINNYLNRNEKEKMIIENFWGINGCEKIKQKEISEMCGYSQSYVSRIKNNVVKKLRIELEK